MKGYVPKGLFARCSLGSLSQKFLCFLAKNCGVKEVGDFFPCASQWQVCGVFFFVMLALFCP